MIANCRRMGLLCVCCWCSWPTGAEADGSAAAQGARTLLLVDDHDILYRSGTERVVHPFERHPGNPVVRDDTSWGNGDIAWNSVYRDPETGLYQLWYQAYPGNKAQEKTHKSLVCYAESKDGIHFTMPELDLFSYNGLKPTNIVMIGSGGSSARYCNSVVVDPNEKDADRRYKMAYYDFGQGGGKEYPGLHVAFSPDGIHWTKYTRKTPLQRVAYGDYNCPVPFQDEREDESRQDWRVPLSMSDAVDVFWDPRLEVFAIYGKSWIDGPSGGMNWKHAVARIESPDFIHWSKPQLVMLQDDRDPPWVEFHTAPVFFYKDCYFSLIQILNRAAIGGALDIELSVSRDGFDWKRPFREPFVLPRSKGNKFDSGSIFTNSTPIILEKEIRFYYGGYSVGATGAYGDELISGIGFASIPLDRFAGVRPLPESKLIGVEKPLENIGQVTLEPIDQKELRGGVTLNADAAAGAIRVEVLDENGNRVRGFSYDESMPIRGDSLEHPVAWKSRKLSDLVPGRYMLRIHLENVTVYAVTVVSLYPIVA